LEQFLLNLVSGVDGVFAYGIVLLILLACGIGLPVPEDVSLILGGFLVYEGRAELFLMMLVGYAGILLGDSMIFFIGRRLGSKVGTSPKGLLSKIITPAKRARVEELFKRHGEKIVMIARFMPGVRSVTYFTAGSVGMKYSHFAFFDSVAALVSAPVFIYLGYRFGGQLEFLLHQIRRGQRGVMIGLILVGLVSYLVYRWRSRKERERNRDALERKVTGDHIEKPNVVPEADRLRP